MNLVNDAKPRKPRRTKVSLASSDALGQRGANSPVPTLLKSTELAVVDDYLHIGSRESELLRFNGFVNGSSANVRYLIDSAASNCFVSHSFLSRSDLLKYVYKSDGKVRLGNNQIVPTKGRIPLTVKLGNGYSERLILYVFDLPEHTDVILGMPWLKAHNPVIDWKARTMSFDWQTDRVTVRPPNQLLPSEFTFIENLLSLGEFLEEWDSCTEEEKDSLFMVIGRPDISLPKIGCSDGTAPDVDVSTENVLSPNIGELVEDPQNVGRVTSVKDPVEVVDSTEDVLNSIKIGMSKEKFLPMLEKFKSCFAPIPKGIPQRTIMHDIVLDPNAPIPAPKMYRLTLKEQDELKAQLEMLIERGWIRPSTSPYGAPVLFALKKNGKLRMCIDYRLLNSITVKDRYPIPHTEDCLNRLGRGKIFSSLDGTSGYWQVGLTKDSIPKTAMLTKYGSYEWLVMPFGLTNAPATFQRLMNHVLQPLLDTCVVVYLDDILIFSESLEEHVKHLEMVLTLLREHKIYLQPAKCEIAVDSLEFLGHIVTANGIQVDPKKVEVIKTWPLPANAGDVRSFLGLSNYYRRFIGNYAEITAPLTSLLRTKVSWSWTKECENAFNILKERLTSAPLLSYPDPSKPFYVFFDASNKIALGGVLCQADDNSALHPVAFESRKLLPAELNYPVHELETLAFVHCLKKWKHYLDLSRFYVYTDNRSVSSILTNTNPSPRLARWIEWIQSFQFTIRHIPRDENTVADALSKCSHASLPTVLLDSDDLIFMPEYLCVLSSQLPVDDLITRLRAAYADDSYWNSVREELNSENSRKDYYFYDGLIYRTEDNRLCLPNNVQILNDVLDTVHDSPLAGHLGVDKTIRRFNENYFMFNCVSRIKDYVRSCDSCQKVKASNQKPFGLLQPLEIPSGRWLHISLDFITGLSLTKDKYDSILTVVDRFSKRAHFIPSKMTDTAEDVAYRLLSNVFK